jgi:hypothetical protein
MTNGFSDLGSGLPAFSFALRTSTPPSQIFMCGGWPIAPESQDRLRFFGVPCRLWPSAVHRDQFGFENAPELGFGLAMGWANALRWPQRISIPLSHDFWFDAHTELTPARPGFFIRNTHRTRMTLLALLVIVYSFASKHLGTSDATATWIPRFSCFAPALRVTRFGPSFQLNRARVREPVVIQTASF